MHLRRCLLFLFLALGPPIMAQQYVTGTITGTSCVSLDVTGSGTVGISITGSWTGTIQPQIAIGGDAAQNAQVTPYSSSTGQSTISANGTFTASVVGATLFQVCGNTVTNTASVKLTSVRLAANRNAGVGTITGSGTANTVAGFSGPTALQNSPITYSGNDVSINTGNLTISSLNPSGANKTHLYVDGVTYLSAQAAIAACPSVGCIVTDLIPEDLTSGGKQPFCSGTWSPLTPATCTAGSWVSATLELGYGQFTTDYMIIYGGSYERIIGPSISVGQSGTATGAIIKATAIYDQTGPDAGHPMVRLSPLFTGSNYKFGNVLMNVTLDCTTASAAGKVCEMLVNDGDDEHGLVQDVRLLAPKPPTATPATTALTRAGCPGSCVVTVTTAAITGCTTGCVLNNGQQVIIAGTTSATDSFNGTFTVASHTEVANITTSFTYNQPIVTTNESATGQGTIRVAGEYVGIFGNGAQNFQLKDLDIGCGTTGFQDAATNGIVIGAYSLRMLSGLTYVCGAGTTPNAGVLVTGGSVDPIIQGVHGEGLGQCVVSFVNNAGGFVNNVTVANTSAGAAVCFDSTAKAVDLFDININVAGTLSVLSDATFSPTFTASTTIGHMGYYLLGLTSGNTHTYWSDIKSFADPQQAIALIEQAAPTIQAITGVNQGGIWNDSTAHRLKFCYGNGNCVSTDTVVGLATTDAFTNKTYDTSATGNLFKFNQTNAQTTTYQVLAADFTSCKHIPVSSGTFTITLVASGSQPPDGQCIVVQNYGSGVVTVARSGQNINGAAVNVTINAGTAAFANSVLFRSNGTDYFSEPYGNLFSSSATCGTGLAVVGNGTNQSQCLSGLTYNGTGANTKFNNVATVGIGLPAVYGIDNVTGSSATRTAQNILASTPAAGEYIVNWYIDQNAPCTTGTNSVTVAINWTDATAARVSGTLGTLTTTTSGASTGAFAQGVFTLWAANASAITDTTTYVGTCTTGTSTYDFHADVKRIQ